jgi:hypothetical protein
LGKLPEAQRSLNQLLELNKGKLNESMHYVLGGMAEAYGFPEVARSEYNAFAKPNDPDPTATYDLAQRRLKSLDKSARH